MWAVVRRSCAEFLAYVDEVLSSNDSVVRVGSNPCVIHEVVLNSCGGVDSGFLFAGCCRRCLKVEVRSKLDGQRFVHLDVHSARISCFAGGF